MQHHVARASSSKTGEGEGRAGQVEGALGVRAHSVGPLPPPGGRVAGKDFETRFSQGEPRGRLWLKAPTKV